MVFFVDLGKPLSIIAWISCSERLAVNILDDAPACGGRRKPTTNVILTEEVVSTLSIQIMSRLSSMVVLPVSFVRDTISRKMARAV